MPSKPAIIDMDIARRFAIVRDILNFNQAAMAKACNMDQSMISRIEAGNRDLPVSAIKSLFLSQDVSPMYIIAGIGPIHYKSKEISTDQLVLDLRAEVEILKARFEGLRNDS